MCEVRKSPYENWKPLYENKQLPIENEKLPYENNKSPFGIGIINREKSVMKEKISAWTSFRKWEIFSEIFGLARISKYIENQ